jgi:hypothetical protein
MKAMLAVSASAFVLAGVATVTAQSYGPTYSRTIHQSAGDRDSRGTPKYYQRYGVSRSRHVRSTTGAGPSGNAPPFGPYYEPSIHQSAGDRDSRGTPKYYERY